MNKFSWNTWQQPFIILAPMDGWTDSAFRQIIKKIAPKTLVFTEFVSVDGITHTSRSEKLLKKAIFHQKSEKPLIVQLFGKDSEKFALAAQIMEQLGADGIDINFGCPARKVVNSEHGAALLQKPQLAYEIVEKTKKAVKNIPVSVKTRLGWSDKRQIFDFGPLMFDAGADALTIHGRTGVQKFNGTADWDPILEFKAKYPEKIIIGNGDINSADKTINYLQITNQERSAPNGIMIGREAMTNPWIFTEIFAKLEKQKFQQPSLQDKINLTLKHAKIKEANKGRSGIMEMRKFFASICKGFVGAGEIRSQLMKVESYQEAEVIFNNINL